MATFLYEVITPTILSVAPTAGPASGGTPITILGRNFQTGATVTIGGTPAPGVTAVSAERITAATPIGSDGPADVTVTNPDLGEQTLTGGCTYGSPDTLAYRTPGGTLALPGSMRTENQTARISQTIGQAKTMVFTATEEPAGESVITFSVEGVELFHGTVVSVTARTDGAERLSCWDTQCVDFTHGLSRIHPIDSWTATSASTILGDLLADWAPGFSSSGVQSGLPDITVVLDGTADLWASLVDVCNKAGAQIVLVGSTLYAWSGTSTLGSVTAVTETNTDLQHEAVSAITVETDYKGIINRATVHGAQALHQTAEDSSSLSLYGVAEIVINDNTLETDAECLARAEQALVGVTGPTTVVRYATRDLDTHVGKTVSITLDAYGVDDIFVIQSVEIDQLELVAVGARPRFTVTAVPPDTPVRRAPDAVGRFEEQVVDLANQKDKTPKIDSVPAEAVEGCITSAQMEPTGVTPGTYGDSSHIPTFTVGEDGRLSIAGTVAAGSGITQLTGDVTAGPGAGSQAATLATSGVSAGTYGDGGHYPQITVDAKGRITAASQAVLPSGSGGITQLTGDMTAGPGSGSQASTLVNTSVTAGSYGDATHVAQFTVDAKGRIQGASNVAITGTGHIRSDGTVAFAADQSMGGNQLTNVGTPATGTDAATKNYVDTALAAIPAGGNIRSDGTVAFAADESMGSHKLTNLAAPTSGGDAATKFYVDSAIAAIPGGGGGTSFTAGAALTLTSGVLNVVAGDGLQADPDILNLKLDGTSLTKSSAGLKVSSTSAATLPTVTVYPTATQTFSTNTEGTISFNGVLEDSDGFYASSTPTRLTIPTGKGGRYLIIGQIGEATPPDAVNLHVRLYRNGTRIAQTAGAAATIPLGLAFQSVKQLNLADGDYIELRVYFDNTATGFAPTHDVTAGVAVTFLQLVLIVPTSSGYVTGGAVLSVYDETPSGAINSTNVAYGTVVSYKPNTLRVFLNGVRQHRGIDFSETGTAGFTMTAAPITDDFLLVDYEQA